MSFLLRHLHSNKSLLINSEAEQNVKRTPPPKHDEEVEIKVQVPEPRDFDANKETKDGIVEEFKPRVSVSPNIQVKS